MKKSELKNLKEVYREYELPPKLIKTFHSSTNSELSSFLQDTKYCHNLFDYHYDSRKKQAAIKRCLTESFYKDLKELKTSPLKLNLPVEFYKDKYSHICKEKKEGYKHYYIKSLKVYLLAPKV